MTNALSIVRPASKPPSLPHESIDWMIKRRLYDRLSHLISHFPAVALLGGPRQVGKTTLALDVAESLPSIYLDLESGADRAKLTDRELYLADHEDKLVILDEVHRLPGLFQSLRGLIDRGRRRGEESRAVSAAWVSFDRASSAVW